jgi:hypothetical protein
MQSSVSDDFGDMPQTLLGTRQRYGTGLKNGGLCLENADIIWSPLKWGPPATFVYLQGFGVERLCGFTGTVFGPGFG